MASPETRSPVRTTEEKQGGYRQTPSRHGAEKRKTKIGPKGSVPLQIRGLWGSQFNLFSSTHSTETGRVQLAKEAGPAAGIEMLGGGKRSCFRRTRCSSGAGSPQERALHHPHTTSRSTRRNSTSSPNGTARNARIHGQPRKLRALLSGVLVGGDCFATGGDDTVCWFLGPEGCQLSSPEQPVRTLEPRPPSPRQPWGSRLRSRLGRHALRWVTSLPPCRHRRGLYSCKRFK